jgi:hypothetical protein
MTMPKIATNNPEWKATTPDFNTPLPLVTKWTVKITKPKIKCIQ